MFKNYLRVQPAAIQLLILLSFWSALQLLFYMALPTFLQSVMGIGFNDFTTFFEKDIYQYPALLLGINAVGAVFTFLLPAAVFAYLADPAPVSYLGLEKPKKTNQVFLVIGLGLAMIPVISVLGGWIKELNLGNYSNKLDEQRNKMIQTYLGSGSVLKMLTNVFFIALIPAICEEVFFRGIVQRFAHTWLKKWWLSIGLSALIFAAFHASISELVPILLAGILLGWVYYITSSLWLSILLHLVNNGVQVLIAYIAAGSPQLESFDKQTGNVIGVFSAGLVLTIFLLIRLVKVKTPLPDDWSVVKVEPKEPEWDMDKQ